MTYINSIRITGQAKQVFRQLDLLTKTQGNIPIYALTHKTLKTHPVCPRCGVDWKTLEKMFQDKPPDAVIITSNCECCRLRFAEEIEKDQLREEHLRDMDRTGYSQPMPRE